MSAAARRTATARYVVAAVDEIAPGERKIVTVAGRSIGVFNVGGEFFALRNRCPHQGGALCEGQLWGVLQSERPGEFDFRPSREVIACPWHGWEFHLRTGQSWCAPEKLKVSRYPVDTVAGSELEGDPPAEPIRHGQGPLRRRDLPGRPRRRLFGGGTANWCPFSASKPRRDMKYTLHPALRQSYGAKPTCRELS